MYSKERYCGVVSLGHVDFESCLLFISNEEFEGAGIGEDILTTNSRDSDS